MLNKKNLSLLTAVLFFVFAGVSFAAWTQPPAGTPPTCPTGYAGCDIPINVGNTAQIKESGLTIAAGSGVAIGLVVLNGNVGLGVIPSTGSGSAKLQIGGTVSAAGLKLSTGAGAGYLLVSDAAGIASWASPSSLNLGSGTGETGTGGGWTKVTTLMVPRSSQSNILNQAFNMPSFCVSSPCDMLLINRYTNISSTVRYMQDSDGVWRGFVGANSPSGGYAGGPVAGSSNGDSTPANIFNAGSGQNDQGGCFLTDDRSGTETSVTQWTLQAIGSAVSDVTCELWASGGGSGTGGVGVGTGGGSGWIKVVSTSPTDLKKVAIDIPPGCATTVCQGFIISQQGASTDTTLFTVSTPSSSWYSGGDANRKGQNGDSTKSLVSSALACDLHDDDSAVETLTEKWTFSGLNANYSCDFWLNTGGGAGVGAGVGTGGGSWRLLASTASGTKKSADLPATCLNPDSFCGLLLTMSRPVSSGGNGPGSAQVLFSQTATNSWFAIGASGNSAYSTNYYGTNGDSAPISVVSAITAGAQYCRLYDDESSVETSATKISVVDTGTGSSCEVWVNDGGGVGGGAGTGGSGNAQWQKVAVIPAGPNGYHTVDVPSICMSDGTKAGCAIYLLSKDLLSGTATSGSQSSLIDQYVQFVGSPLALDNTVVVKGNSSSSNAVGDGSSTFTNGSSFDTQFGFFGGSGGPQCLIMGDAPSNGYPQPGSERVATKWTVYTQADQLCYIYARSL